jgi:hypothetical protein
MLAIQEIAFHVQTRTQFARERTRDSMYSGKQDTVRIIFDILKLYIQSKMKDCLCGLVVRVLDHRYRGPGFDSRALQKKSSGSGTGSTQPREYN